jgi:hypothetical protein
MIARDFGRVHAELHYAWQDTATDDLLASAVAMCMLIPRLDIDSHEGMSLSTLRTR